MRAAGIRRRLHGVRLRSVLLGVLGLIVVGWMLARLENSMLYHPTPLTGATPGAWRVPFEAVRIDTPDGAALGAWWCPRPEPAAPVLLFFHGNAGNREDRLHNVAGLWRAGVSVLIFDYRGYGDSSGTPSEAGLYADGAAAFDWLATRVPDRPITLFGRSLGGAVAARVAAVRPAAGLILESTFTSAPDMAGRVLPFPGVRYLVRSRFDALAAVRKLTAPLLVIHGSADELVPISMGRALYEAAATRDKTFREVPGGRHNDTYDVAGDDYWRWLREFLGRAGGRGQARR